MEEAGAFTTEANPFRFYLFDESARALNATGMRSTNPQGESTRMHSSVRKILRSYAGAPPAGLVRSCEGLGADVRLVEWPDHHPYTEH